MYRSTSNFVVLGTYYCESIVKRAIDIPFEINFKESG